MADKSERTPAGIDSRIARDALRAELTARGHDVASDTFGVSRDVYIVGPNDLARALFHFDEDAAEAAMSMCRSSGSWAHGMPPRFAVLPASQADSPSLEMLEQMRAVALFYDIDGDTASFPELDRLLTEHLG